jgi:bacteriorhodopsin
MWAGILVDYKTSDVTPRVIFYPKYLDWIITCPLTLAAICLVAQAEAALLVSLVGNAVLMVLCGLVGSSVVAPYKYVWWALGVMFLVIVLLILGRVMRQGNGRAVRNLVIVTAGTWIWYPIVWVVGSEGTGALGMMQEVAITVLLDLVSKVAFALMVVTSPGVVAVEGGVAYASGYNENERMQSASFAPLL